MIEGIIFDYDGTLYNTNRLIKDAFSFAVRKVLGREMKEEEIKEVWGRPLEEQMKSFSEDYWQELVQAYQEFHAKHSDLAKPFPGVKETLKKLYKKGYKMAIISNKARKDIETGLRTAKLEQYIDYYLGKEDVKKHKPEKEGFKKILKEIKLNPSQLLMVGDSPHDIIGGQRMKIKTVLVSYTYFEINEVLKHKPDYVIDSFPELLKVINEDKRS